MLLHGPQKTLSLPLCPLFLPYQNFPRMLNAVQECLKSILFFIYLYRLYLDYLYLRVLDGAISPLSLGNEWQFHLNIFRSSCPEMFCKGVLRACNFVKKEPLAQLFSGKFCQVLKNIFNIVHLQTTGSAMQTYIFT